MKNRCKSIVHIISPPSTSPNRKGVIQTGGEMSKSAGDLRFCAEPLVEVARFGLREVPGTCVAPNLNYTQSQGSVGAFQF